MSMSKNPNTPHLASVLERLGKTKKKEIIQKLADETGKKPAEVEKALPGVQSAFRGAEIAQSKGLNPQEVGVAGLQKMDPSASADSKKSMSKQDMSNQEMLTVALLGTLPSLISYAVAGPTAGHVTANGSSKIGGMYADQKRYEEKRDREDLQRNQNLQLKHKGLEIQGKAAEGLIAKRNADIQHQQKMEGFRDREVTAKEQKLMSGSGGVDENGIPLIKPSKLTSQQTAKLTSLQAAKEMLSDAKKAVISNQGQFGMRNSAMNLMKVNDPHLNAIDTLLKKTAILTGSGIKGGSLTQEEAHQWEKEMTRKDTAEGLLKKIEIFEKQVADQEHAFLNSARINRQPVPGYEASEKKDLSISGGYPVQRVGAKQEIPPMPDFDKMTEEELKKYLEQKR